MNEKSKTKLIVVLAISLVVSICVIGYGFFRYGYLTVQGAFAEEQTELFYDMRDKALESQPSEAVGFLMGTVAYYPSGTKQDTGSRLDKVVERVRKDVIKQIIADLRLKTGKDLGDDPKLWVEKFSNEDSQQKDDVPNGTNP